MKIYKNNELTNHQYHSMSGISSSMVADIQVSPYKYWYNHVNPYKEEQERKDYFVLGSLVHTLCLEPEFFERDYLIIPKLDRRTKVGKEKYAQIMATADDKEIIKDDQLEDARYYVERVFKNAVAKEIIEKSEPEVSFFWENLKVRTDLIMIDDENKKILISDLKTTLDVKYEKFKRTVDDLYLLRAGFYSYVVKKFYPDYAIDFCYIAVSKTKPSFCTVFEIPNHVLLKMEIRAQDAVQKILDCNEKFDENEWEDTTPEYLTLEF
jgi:hypothetical protein